MRSDSPMSCEYSCAILGPLFRGISGESGALPFAETRLRHHAIWNTGERIKLFGASPCISLCVGMHSSNTDAMRLTSSI